MSRELFEEWGKELTPQGFSIALAGLAVFGPLTIVPTREEITATAKRSVLQKSPPIVIASLPNIASAIKKIKKGQLQFSAQVYAQLWETFFADLAETGSICIELNLKPREGRRVYSAGTGDIDLFWVMQELERSGGAAGAAYFRDNQRERPVAFELPLRFGIFGDRESQKIADIVDTNNWRHLYEIVRPQGRVLECDILLLPFDLPTASEMLRSGWDHIEADCVILMRGVGALNTDGALTLISGMRKIVATGGFSIVTVPETQDKDWLNHLVFLLSHDTPLIHALPEVQKAIVSPATGNPPLIIASRHLAQRARAREFTGRLADVVRNVTPQLGGEAERLVKHIEFGKWNSELGEATEIVRIRKQVEVSLAETLKVPRFGEPNQFVVRQHTAMTRMATVVADDGKAMSYAQDSQQVKPAITLARSRVRDKRLAQDQRHVHMDLYDITDRTSPSSVEDRLLPNRRYEIALFIAALREATAVAPAPFSSDELPSGNNELSVHFVPLVRGIDGKVLASQCKSLVLPETENSEACKFEFDAPPSLEIYRARFIISFRNRVLQTLILSAPVGNAEEEFVLDVENIVDHSFERLTDRPKFDAAIIVNDSPDGASGVIAMKGNEAVFSEPEGLKGMSDAIRQLILKDAENPPTNRKFNCKKNVKLLHQLSRLGTGLWDALPDEARKLFQGSITHIQIIDARIGAYFPAEFVHPGLSPIPEASLCPNIESALRPASPKNLSAKMSHVQCEYKDNDSYICPARMWGLGIVIERQPATGGPTQGFTLQDLTGQDGKACNDVFNHVVLAVSEKVTQFAAEETAKLVNTLKRISKKVSLADNWGALRTIVQDDSPTLLILLPHSGDDKELPVFPALELGGAWLARDHLKEEYVRGAKNVNPVVMLLGCDTNAPEVPFLSFIKKFKDCGAAMVIGTVTQIEAARTVDFVERFVTAASSSNNTVTFGDLLLQVRRSMLAEGDGYALSLLAYGDSDR